MIAGEISNNCLEGCRLPAIGNLITFDNVNTLRLEGTEMVLIEHHVKYKEIHGIDETVWIERSEHSKLHRRLRREGKCKIPVDELNTIAIRANQRTSKYKNLQCRLHRDRTHESKIHFRETIAPNISLFIDIFYYNSTGNVSVTSYFQKGYGKKLKTIKEQVQQ